MQTRFAQAALSRAWPKAPVPECLLSRRCWEVIGRKLEGPRCFYDYTSSALGSWASGRLPLLLSLSSKSPNEIYSAISVRARCGGRALLVIGKLAKAVKVGRGLRGRRRRLPSRCGRPSFPKDGRPRLNGLPTEEIMMARPCVDLGIARTTFETARMLVRVLLFRRGIIHPATGAGEF